MRQEVLALQGLTLKFKRFLIGFKHFKPLTVPLDLLTILERISYIQISKMILECL